jgi:hypothetical protein
MQKQRFAAEQEGRGHAANCLSLYTTLTMFTSQMVTRNGRKGLRKFLLSGMKDVHEPLLLARYVIGPANHLLNAQTKVLKANHRIAEDPAVSLKITWLARQILFKKMLSILDVYGWEPTVHYKSNDEMECMEWLISKQSRGSQKVMGIRGVTQLAFQAYAHKMANAPLFTVLREGVERRIDGKGVIMDQKHLDEFIADDYGFNPKNNITKYIQNVKKG